MCHSFAALDITICPEEQILNCNQHDTDDVAECENQEVEEFTMIEESPLSGIDFMIVHIFFFNLFS